MNMFKFLAKIGARIAAIAALLCFAHTQEEQKYIIVYEDEK